MPDAWPPPQGEEGVSLMPVVRRCLVVVPLLALAAILVGLPAVAFGEKEGNTFGARLIGYNEVPSINTGGSATLTLHLDASPITFELKYAGLSGAPGAAHIHFGQARTNGGVSVFFCGGGGKPACPATTAGTVTGTIEEKDVIGPTLQGIAVGDLPSIVRAIRAGAAYANMHTAKFGSGEIRGQIQKTDD
jgi:hypothetical protein